MSLVPRLPLSLEELLAYYRLAIRECDFIESVLLSGLDHINERMKPSPLVSVTFNNYEAYYLDFLKHLKWRLSDLCVDHNYDFSNSDKVKELISHDYKHSGVAHPIDEREIMPLLESIDLVRSLLGSVVSTIEHSLLSSVFLCHSSEDKDHVRRIAFELTAKGARVWLDEAEIGVGDSIIEKIQAGISESDFLGIILSPRSVKSIWVRKEVEAALTVEIDSGRTKVLPILIEPCEVPLFLRPKKYADLSAAKTYENGINSLVKALSK